MKGLSFVKRAVAIATICALGAPQAGAIEIFGGPNPAAHMSDDLLTQVRGGGGRGGGGHRHGGGGMHRGGMHGGMNRGGGHNFNPTTSTATSTTTSIGT